MTTEETTTDAERTDVPEHVLAGIRVAILATNGVEQVELTEPRAAIFDAGGTTELVSLEVGEIQAMNHDTEAADVFTVDRAISDVSADDFEALVLPGGTTNPDTLRQSTEVVDFVKSFFAAGKPVGVICHGAWTLVEADVVRGRTLTSYPSIRTDIRNAGGIVVDEEVVDDHGLVSSRNPDDLPAFCAKIVEVFAVTRHPVVDAGATADVG
ncbi:type 1 glutamine amidotransferase [Antrihabitans sp. YC3-6]|uniref:Type 1 glutamine amidotransferase n=1 Tax=Antrihabitans stalagmiti TaxID=2799499 RepID=A0A934U1N4_9NOCA|nr:type 1 glutamine amidotransferase domain-containing protein [Antrihabitans stalagmiti]MBJ8337563.1 type 1 glutamine amidotransferase [Antrihabitans stalagmiti]